MSKRISRHKSFALSGVVALLLSLAPLSAHAIDPTFSCGGGGTYQVTNAGEAINGSACTGDISGNLTLDSSVLSIGSDAFSGATFSSVTLPNSVVIIGQSAFDGIATLQHLYIGSGVTRIDSYAYGYPESIVDITVSGDNSSYSSQDGVLFNKNKTTLLHYPAQKAERNYTIPNSVTQDIDDAMTSPTYLESVTISSHLSRLDQYFLIYAPALKAINVQPNNPSYASIDGVLTDSTSATLLLYPTDRPNSSYSVPSSIRYIADGAVNNTNHLGTLNIPSTLLDLGYNNLYGCQALSAITVDPANSNYSSIDGVLTNKTKTSLIFYPTSRPNLRYVTPASINTLTSNSFTGTKFLQSLVISDTVTTLDRTSFNNLEALRSIKIGNGVTRIEENLLDHYSTPKLKYVSIGRNVTSIGRWAFAGLTELESLYIPDSVTYIEMYAFRDIPSLTKLHLGTGLIFRGAYIDYEILQGSSALTTYEYCGTGLSPSQLNDLGLYGKTNTGCSTPASLTNILLSNGTSSTGSTGTNFVDTITYTSDWQPGSIAITSGSLPAGLTLDPLTGAISGTPTAIGDYTIGVLVTDEVSSTGSAFFAFHISQGSTPPNNDSPPVTPSPVPDPVQQSVIKSFNPSETSTDSSTLVTVLGSFIEKVRNIQANGINILQGSWTQTPTTLTFTVAKTSDANISILIFNGAVPVLKLDPITVKASPKIIAAQTKQRVQYISCRKPGKGTRIAYGVNPSCPKGYIQKMP